MLMNKIVFSAGVLCYNTIELAKQFCVYMSERDLFSLGNPTVSKLQVWLTKQGGTHLLVIGAETERATWSYMDKYAPNKPLWNFALLMNTKVGWPSPLFSSCGPFHKYRTVPYLAQLDTFTQAFPVLQRNLWPIRICYCSAIYLPQIILWLRGKNRTRAEALLKTI